MPLPRPLHRPVAKRKVAESFLLWYKYQKQHYLAREIEADGNSGTEISDISVGGPDRENPGLALTFRKRRRNCKRSKRRCPGLASGTIPRQPNL